MTLRLNTHKIAAGIQTVSYMNSTAVQVIDFPLQTDQQNGWIEWEAPSYELGTTQPMYARYRINGNQVEIGDGPRLFDWVFDYFTNDMLAYWKATFADNSAVTVLTYDDEDDPIYLTAVLLHPKPRQQMEWAEGGWKNVRFRFRQGVVIT